MKKSAFIFLIGVLTTNALWANVDEEKSQDTSETDTIAQEPKKDELLTFTKEPETLHVASPSYGSLIVDWGLNMLRNSPQEMKRAALDTRSFNLAGYYNIRLGGSHFTISPGIKMGSEEYKFERNYTLARDKNNRKHTEFKSANELLTDDAKILQSTLSTKYWSGLVEFRINADKQYPKEGFFIAVGGEIGMLWKVATKIRYQEDDQTKQRIIKEPFNLNQMRCGVQGRLGWGRFSIFYKHMLTNLFNEKKGPKNSNVMPSTIGFSVDLF